MMFADLSGKNAEEQILAYMLVDTQKQFPSHDETLQLF